MRKKAFAKKILAFMALCLIFAISSPDAFAAWGWRKRLHDRHEVITYGGHMYHYDDGRFYSQGPLGFFAVIPQAGTIVAAIPVGCSTLIIGSTTYYCYDDIYYNTCPSGYIVVPAPRGHRERHRGRR